MLEQYEYQNRYVLIEAKASGLALADELMRNNIPCPHIVPVAGKEGRADNHFRTHMVALRGGARFISDENSL